MSGRRLISSLIAASLLAGCGGHAPLANVATRSAQAVFGGVTAARDTQDPVPAAGDEALRILRHNIHTVQCESTPRDRSVVFAGGGHFGSLWARDGSYACMGLLASGEHAVVHDTLTALLDAQRQDGLVPRRIGNGSNAVGIARSAIGLPPTTSTAFKTDDFTKPSVDTNPLVIWVASEYVQASHDLGFASRYKPALERAAEWLYARQDGGLLAQAPYTDWKDMVARGGKVMYTNTVYYRALTALAGLERAAGDETRAQVYDVRARELAAHIQAVFWDATAGHFRDSLAQAQFSPDGDLFAVVVGLTTPDQTELILKRCEAILTLQPLLPALEGDYPSSMIPLPLKLGGISHYHDRYEWPWLTSLYAWAAATAGDQRRAHQGLERVATNALREGTFEEIYEGNGPTPVKTRFYQSEVDFSWSAGMFLKAKSALR